MRRARPAFGLTVSPFGKNYYTVLEYQDLLDLQSVGGVLNYLTYAINDVYDPYTGAGGHQPRFLDTFIGANTTDAPYRQYRVFGCKVEATFINTASAIGDQFQAFMRVRDDNASPLVDIIDLGEAPNIISKPCSSGNGGGIVRMSKYVSMKNFLGVKDLKDDEFSTGDYQSSPTTRVYMDIGIAPYQLVNAGANVIVHLTYYVQFFEQNYPAQS